MHMNIQVNDPSGGITGVIDWENATYGPFGIALASLEIFLGIGTGEGVWIWHPRQDCLRDAFYKILCRQLDRHPETRHLYAGDIEAARIYGLFFMYGDWAAAEINDRGAAPVTTCLDAGLGDEATAQLFLRQQ
ncbi:hypothetical protein F4818DRAFT_435914 [Hypoxylon cercidicola]|nr:hypothetical protein F4818DRAFT_435914 [Hypoxylon cercidicola]